MRSRESTEDKRVGKRGQAMTELVISLAIVLVSMVFLVRFLFREWDQIQCSIETQQAAHQRLMQEGDKKMSSLPKINVSAPVQNREIRISVGMNTVKAIGICKKGKVEVQYAKLEPSSAH